jgi:hypothetical protein
VLAGTLRWRTILGKPCGDPHYGPFYTWVIPATMSEAPYVLDGLHHHAHQTDLRIREPVAPAMSV